MGQPNGFAQIPDKAYFKIGEVCDITAIKSHTLRYWESEFTVIKPQRADSKQRLYRKVDVENVLKIKSLIYDKGMTLAGVKKYLAQEKTDHKEQKTSSPQVGNILGRIKEELVSIKKILS
nr:MerR family transcriptional regulator [Desulfobulbaceae bacterium]